LRNTHGAVIASGLLTPATLIALGDEAAAAAEVGNH